MSTDPLLRSLRDPGTMTKMTAAEWISVMQRARPRALLGKRLDDEIRVQTPAGEREFLIAEVAYEAPA